MGGSIEPGWYADPEGTPGQLRWWNGSEWTHHVRPLSEFTAQQQAAKESAATQHATSVDQGDSPDEATIALKDDGASPGAATVRFDPPATSPSPDNPTANLTPGPPAGDGADQATVDLGESPADQATINLDNPPGPVDATVGLDPASQGDAPAASPASNQEEADEVPKTAVLGPADTPKTAVLNPNDPSLSHEAAGKDAAQKNQDSKFNKLLGDLKEGIQEYRAELAEERKKRQEEQRRKAEEEARRRAERAAQEAEEWKKRAGQAQPAPWSPAPPTPGASPAEGFGVAPDQSPSGAHPGHSSFGQSPGHTPSMPPPGYAPSGPHPGYPPVQQPPYVPPHQQYPYAPPTGAQPGAKTYPPYPPVPPAAPSATPGKGTPALSGPNHPAAFPSQPQYPPMAPYARDNPPAAGTPGVPGHPPIPGQPSWGPGQSGPYPSYPPAPQKKKKGGCFGCGCATLILILVVSGICTYLWLQENPLMVAIFGPPSLVGL